MNASEISDSEESQHDVVTFYNRNISAGHYKPSSGVQIDERYPFTICCFQLYKKTLFFISF